MTWPEKQAFMKTVVDTARGRVPIFVGTSTLNTRDTIEQTRWASEIGADGTMLGPPFWCLASMDTAVQFFKDVAEACPDMAIAIYANMQAFKFAFSIPFWARVSQIPQVITAKLPPVPQMSAMKLVTGGRIRFMPIDNEYASAATVRSGFLHGLLEQQRVVRPGRLRGIARPRDRGQEIGRLGAVTRFRTRWNWRWRRCSLLAGRRNLRPTTSSLKSTA